MDWHISNDAVNTVVLVEHKLMVYKYLKAIVMMSKCNQLDFLEYLFHDQVMTNLPNLNQLSLIHCNLNLIYIDFSIFGNFREYFSTLDNGKS